MDGDRITSSAGEVLGTFEVATPEAGGWLPVAEEAQTTGLEIEAYWEGDPARITRVSVRGARTGAASDAAVRRVLRAYGVADGVTLSWEAGEGEDEQVAFVSVNPVMGPHHPNASWSQDVIENVYAAMLERRSAAAVVREAESWLLPAGVSRKTYMAAVRYELRAYAPSHGSAAR